MRRTSLLVFWLVACGGGSDDTSITPPPPPPAAVASVTVTSSAVSLTPGQSAQLSATVRDAQGNTLTGRSVTWSSSADAIASVSSAGLVTALAPGAAQIRATSEGRTGDATVTVTAVPWTLTGSMSIGRTLHTATLLTNGKVLVTGGQTLGAPFITHASSELYDPVSGTWSPTGSLATGRENHVAIRLPNGKVLIAGGYSIETQTRLRSAEVYDPVTGTWSSAGNMSAARDNPIAALLTDGTVLVTGGSTSGTGLDAINSSEIFDATTGVWTTVGSTNVARAAHSGALLANGKVLVTGGASGSFASPQLHGSAELYDPTTKLFSPAGQFPTARGYHKAVALTNGKVLIVGGSNFTSASYAAADLYDGATGTWSTTGAMTIARVSHTATLLANGRVLVAGGIGNSGGVSSSAEIYDPATGLWTVTPAMRTARANHATVRLADGKILLVGGQGTGASTSAELFDPSVSGSGAGAQVAGRP